MVGVAGLSAASPPTPKRVVRAFRYYPSRLHPLRNYRVIHAIKPPLKNSIAKINREPDIKKTGIVCFYRRVIGVGLTEISTPTQSDILFYSYSFTRPENIAYPYT
jgi:hypothetical protein